MSQTIDKINSCYPLFEQDEYQELFRNKRQLEEAHDAQRVQEVFAWTTTAEYEALNFQREALTVDPAKPASRLVRCFARWDLPTPCRTCTALRGAWPTFAPILTAISKSRSACVSDSMTEDAAVFGGNNNMNLGPAERQRAVQTGDHCGVHHLHGGSYRR